MVEQLDAASAAQERMHEAALHAENEMRGLRAAVDEAQHTAASERSAAGLRLSEAQREIAQLKVEMDRRQTEGVRREGLLQRSRDELASAAAQQEREASMQLAAARDDEAARVRRLEAERTRLNEQLVQAQSEAAAQAVQLRDRSDALQGEVAALKAELHGSTLERRAADDEGQRMRRRAEEAEGRLEGTLAEVRHASPSAQPCAGCSLPTCAAPLCSGPLCALRALPCTRWSGYCMHRWSSARNDLMPFALRPIRSCTRRAWSRVRRWPAAAGSRR